MRNTITSSTILILATLIMGTSQARSDGTNPTTSVTLSGNLRAGGFPVDAETPAAIPFSNGGNATFASLTTLAGYSTRFDMFDSLHGKHAVYLFFLNDDLGVHPLTPAEIASGVAFRWIVRAVVDGSDIEGGTPGVPVGLGTDGVIDFDENGAMVIPQAGVSFMTISAGQFSEWFPGTAITPVSVHLGTVTQFVGTSQLDAVTESASAPTCTDGVAQLHVGLTAIGNALGRISKPRNSRQKRHLITYLTRAESAVSIAQSTAIPLSDSLCFSGKKNEYLGHLRELSLELQLSEFLFPNDRVANLTNTLSELNALVAAP